MEGAKQIKVDEEGKVIGSRGSPYPESLRIEDREGNVTQGYKLERLGLYRGDGKHA